MAHPRAGGNTETGLRDDPSEGKVEAFASRPALHCTALR